MRDLDVADTESAVGSKKSKSAKKPAKSKSTATKTAQAPKAAAQIKISDEQRLSMIAEAAYFKAEKRGFTGGDPVDDWIAAESEVNALLSNPIHQTIA